MNITVTRALLMDALHCVRKAAPKKDALPILKHVAIAASSDGVTLCMTDLDLYVRATIALAEIRESGAICVPAQLLADVVAELPPDCDVEMRCKDFHLHIGVSRGFTSRIAGVEIEQFPDPPTLNGVSAAVDKTTLLRVIASVGICASRDTTRLALNGVCITRNRRHAHAVATDGFRLGRMSVGSWLFGEDDGAGEWIVPVDALKAAAGMCVDETPIQIQLDSSAISLSTQVSTSLRAQVFRKLVEGPYPAWKQVIRADSPHRLILQRDSLLAALRRAIAISRGPAPRIIVRTLTNPARICIFSLGPDATLREGEETIPAHIATEGIPPEWSCNPVYLEELASLSPSSEVRIETGEALQAIHITPEAPHSDQFWLLMPLRIDAKDASKGVATTGGRS